MIVASVCSGIGAPEVAWRELGWEHRFVAEIEPFACAVLKHHFPEVLNLGDFTGIERDTGPVDLLVAGTPCQSFSVAGRRAGVDDPRGVLAFEFLRLAERLRAKWIVFENVPGLLSSSGGADFGSWLGTLAQIGYGFAYRILDGQFTGVPQRRKRLWVVGYRGDWRPPVAVLFDRASLRGGSPPRRETGEKPAATIGAGIGRRRGASSHDGTELIAHTIRSEGFDASEDGTVRGVPLIPFDLNQITSKANRSNPQPGDPLHPVVQGRPPLMTNATFVRRLTPREVERCFGFEDDYTLVPYRGKPAADGPRYRALGNSMIVPELRWIGQRIAMVEEMREC